MNMNNISSRDILDDLHLKENPFSMPEGYLSSLENSVHEKIFPVEPVSPFLRFINLTKSYALLALSFAIVFGIGYGVISLTGSLEKETIFTEGDDFALLIENGYINRTFVDYLYDEIDIEQGMKDSESEIVIYDELSERIERNLSEEDIMEYLGIDDPYTTK